MNNRFASILCVGLILGSSSAIAATQNFNVTLTFGEFPVGTEIHKQYKPQGIIFSGDSPVIADDSANPTSPVLGTPDFTGTIKGAFVDPKTGGAVTVSAFSLDAGHFDDLKSTQLTWFDKKGKKLGSKLNPALDIYRFNISGKDIASWSIQPIGSETNGYAIDNVSFNAPQEKCNDTRDKIVQEYKAHRIDLRPLCQNFTRSASTAFYTFAELNTGDYKKFALLRAPLMAASSLGYGLDEWVDMIGTEHMLTGGYRNPANNVAVGGPKQSRHMYGDAADLKNDTRTEKERKTLIAAAENAGADYIEPEKVFCHLKCVHADWRAHVGPYVQ